MTTSSGHVTITTANAGTEGVTGVIRMQTGVSTSGNSGLISLTTGKAVAGKAGDITLDVGTGDTGNGGDMVLTAGQATGAPDGAITTFGGIALVVERDTAQRALAAEQIEIGRAHV